jgi:hypothetical protein
MTTMGAYEGDLVRPLGFVTLYFAYAEGQLDEVLKALIQATGLSEPKIQSFGAKVGEAVQLVAKIGVHRLPGLAAVLQEARPLVEARNKLVHGQLFNGGRLVSRVGIRHVNSQEIENLAEGIFSWKERLWQWHCRELMPVMSQIVGEERESEHTAAQ